MVVVLWAQRAKPQIIMLENVEEFADWGPLLDDGRPCPERRGLTFRRWVRQLRRAGYRVEWRELRACDYGSPTIRKRLFLIARRDGAPIVWPAPTHGPGLRPYRTAAECIDWSIPAPSIFLTKDEAKPIGCRRPLAPATMRRIAKGVFKYVIQAADPFIVPITHVGDDRTHPIHEPLRTITTAHRGEFALISPYFVPRYGEREGQEPRAASVEQPAHTVVPTGNGANLVTAFLARQFGRSTGQQTSRPAPTTTAGGGGKTSLITAFLAQHNTGMTGHDARAPLSTIVQRGTTQGLVTAFLSHQHSSNASGGEGNPCKPLNAVLAGGTHRALVKAFLMKYYGEGGQWARCDCPNPTITCKHRVGIVTVDEIDYQIVDIGMRMLTPRELFRAQGFPDDYVIDPVHAGRPLNKTAQVRMCGNSVCPQLAEALVRANIRSSSNTAIAS